MASYTMELREMVEHYSQFDDKLSHNEKIAIAREKIFDFNYPIFDENYRNVFETNFIRNFYMREIGFETEGLFKFQLETWLLINMPYYNKLFESELIEFNPLESYSLKTTYQKKNDTTQDEDRSRLQTDNKTVSQNDVTKNQLNETEIKTQKETNVINQNDNKNITQNDETTLKHDGNTTTDTTDSNTQTSLNEGTVDSNTTTDSTADRETTGKTKETTDDFNREIMSDNPDTRLELTAKDGEGVIPYASTIKEHSENDVKETTSEGTEKQSDKTDATTATTTLENGEVVNEGDSHSDTTVKTDDYGTLKSNIGETNNSKIDGETTGNESNQKNNVIDGSLKSDITDNLSSNVNDKSKATINNMEDYIENRVGSIGVKTYSEMINEYRGILLRIEKQIFKEMNELFMLVY